MFVLTRTSYTSQPYTFLPQLLSHTFVALLNENQHIALIASLRSLIQILGSPQVASDNRHPAALYSRFLSSQLTAVSARFEGTIGTSQLSHELSSTKIPQARVPLQGAVLQPALDHKLYQDPHIDSGLQHFLAAAPTHGVFDSEHTPSDTFRSSAPWIITSRQDTQGWHRHAL